MLPAQQRLKARHLPRPDPNQRLEVKFQLASIKGCAEADQRSKPPLDLAAAEVAMLKAQFEQVKQMAYSPDGLLLHPRLLDSYRRRATIAAEFSGKEEERDQDIAAHYGVILAAIGAGRAELVRLHRTRQIDDETLHDLERDLDLEEMVAIAAKS
ncbi:hypothetical protein [Teichococcus aerofrigidensis]